MTCERFFLGWERDPLKGAAKWFWETVNPEASDMPFISFRNVTVVVPGARTGRLFLEALLKANAATNGFTPPAVITLNALPELLYLPQARLASEIERLASWYEALQTLPTETLHTFLPELPASAPERLRVAKVFNTLEQTLAWSALDFHDVAHLLPTLPLFNDARRWEILSDLYTLYLEKLQTVSLVSADRERLEAAREKRKLRTQTIVLLGISEIPTLVKKLLTQSESNVRAVILAPPALAPHFNTFGEPISDFWKDALIDIPLDAISVVADSKAQAQTTVAVISRMHVDHALPATNADFTIGTCDAAETPTLVTTLEEHGIPCKPATGRKLFETSLGKLLTVLNNLFKEDRFETGVLLFHNAIIQQYLLRTLPAQSVSSFVDILLADVDCVQTNHLPTRFFNGPSVAMQKHSVLCAAWRAILEVLAPFSHDSTTTERSCARWCECTAQLIKTLFGESLLQKVTVVDSELVEALEHIAQELHALRVIAERAFPTRTFSVSDFLEVLALTTQHIQLTPSVNAGIEILGWLELPFDPAPNVVITSACESYLPQNFQADPFLPHALRQALQLPTNESRFARDAFLLTALQRSRARLHLIVPRAAARPSAGSGARAQAVIPSRLLFRVPTEELAQRVATLYGNPTMENTAQIHPRATPTVPLFTPPYPSVSMTPPTKISVTGFRDYITCPYRYYLKHILGLTPYRNSPTELAHRQFGSLAHQVLCQYGRSKHANTTDLATATDTLTTLLHAIAEQQFSSEMRTTVRLQLSILETRLLQFAKWQVARAAEGWQIHMVEFVIPTDQCGFDFEPGERIALKGRIDRIDYHPQRNVYALLDYKLSDTVTLPEKAHKRGGQWIDLQLPAYLWAAQNSGLLQAAELGYIVLPANLEGTGHRMANWSALDLEEAFVTMQSIAYNIHKQRFWPPAQLRPDQDDFSSLFRDQAEWFAAIAAESQTAESVAL
jgi:ATP-dependent helicase/nuclease subunit B